MPHEAHEVRKAILAWAARHGVLNVSASGDPGVQQGDPDILPFEPQHAEFFRTRKIVRVVEEGRTLRIFSRLKVAATKISKLRQLFRDHFEDSGLRLAIDISRPFKVDQKIENYGGEPIYRTGDRIACGSSVGIGNQRNAGTLTALARSSKVAGALFGLSCNHVVGGCSTARPGTPIVVPGIQDVSAELDEIHVVGRHFAAASMSQGLPSVFDITSNRDLACFELTAADLLTSMQGSGEHAYDTPSGFAGATIGMAVKKWGRSTGLTFGEITNVVRDGEPVDYNVTSYYGPMYSQVFKGTVYFSEVYEVEPRGGASSQGGPFSAGGDSGSLVVTRKNGSEKVVGIVIAGGKDKSLLLPLKPALKVLGLQLVSGHGVGP